MLTAVWQAIGLLGLLSWSFYCEFATYYRWFAFLNMSLKVVIVTDSCCTLFPAYVGCSVFEDLCV